MSNISQSVVQAAIEELKAEEDSKRGEKSYPMINKGASGSQKHRRRLKKTTAKAEPQKIDDSGLVDPQPADGISSNNPADNNVPSANEDSVDSKIDVRRRFRAVQDVAILTSSATNAVHREKSKACVLQ